MTWLYLIFEVNRDDSVLSTQGIDDVGDQRFCDPYAAGGRPLARALERAYVDGYTVCAVEPEVRGSLFNPGSFRRVWVKRDVAATNTTSR